MKYIHHNTLSGYVKEFFVLFLQFLHITQNYFFLFVGFAHHPFTEKQGRTASAVRPCSL